MINVSEAWKSRMNSDTAYTTSAVISLADGTVLTVTPADVCVSTNKFTDGAGASSFPVGAAMSRTMQIELDNGDERYADVDFQGAVIRLSLNYRGESIALGRYTVRQPETYGATVIITAQDDMYKADKPFSTALTYPATAGALWAEICAACGITDGMTGGIPQSGAPIAAAPAPDLTYRAVLGYIAMLSGGNARVNRLGSLEIVNYDFDALEAQRTAGTAEGLHDLTMWRSLRLDMEDVTVTGVQTTVYDGAESSTVLVGAEGYVLSMENPLIAGREREALEVIGAALIGKRFRGFSGEYIAYPLAEFGDGARITDRKGNHAYTVITDVDFTWASYTVLANSAEAPLRNAAKYTPPEATTLQRAAQMVQAEKTAREAAVEVLQQALAAAGGMYETTAQAAGGGTIYYLHDKPTLAASDIVLKLTAEALGISTDGGETYPYGVSFATSTVITNILQANGIDADDIAVSGTLHSSDYVRSDSPYADVGLGIELNNKRIASTNFGVTPAGALYARSGKIAEATMGKGQAHNYKAAPHSFVDINGDTASYTYDSSANSATVSTAGTLAFNIAVNASDQSGTYELNKLWCRVHSGGVTTEDWETPAGRVYYLNGTGGVLYESEYSGLRYVADGSTVGFTFTMNPEYLHEAASIRLEVDLDEGDDCSVQRRYGVYAAIYYGSEPTLKGAEDGVYFGTDGISVGEDICLTPDGHGHFDTLTAGTGEFSGNVKHISRGITDGTTPASNKWGANIGFMDATGGKYLGAFQAYSGASGRQGFLIAAFRTVGGTRRGNGLYMLVDSAGNPYVSLNRAAWQDALGVTTTFGTYTPTFSWSSSGAPTVATGGTYQWIRSGNVMMIHGRFNITALNAPATAGMLQITLPSGIAVVNSVAAVGQMMAGYSHMSDFVCRVASAYGPIAVGTPAAGAISGAMQAGWHNFFVILFVT